MAVVLLVFLGLPLALVVTVSFFDYDDFSVYPAFLLRNYLALFSSSMTYRLYVNTLRYAAVVWALTLVIGWAVAYFLVFHVRTSLWRMALFLVCAVPFWTSTVAASAVSLLSEMKASKICLMPSGEGSSTAAP